MINMAPSAMSGAATLSSYIIPYAIITMRDGLDNKGSGRIRRQIVDICVGLLFNKDDYSLPPFWRRA